jgi:hypothetical protein
VDEGGQAAHGRALDHEVERLALPGGHLRPGRDRVLEQGQVPARPQDPAQLPEGLAVVEGVHQRLHGVGAVEALVRERQLAVVQAVEPQRAGQAQPRRLGPGPPQVGLEQVDPVDPEAEAGAQADGTSPSPQPASSTREPGGRARVRPSSSSIRRMAAVIDSRPAPSG